MIEKLLSIFRNLSMRTTVTLSSLTLTGIAVVIAAVSALSLYDVSKITDRNGRLVDGLSSMNAAAVDLETFIYQRDPALLAESREKLDQVHSKLNGAAQFGASSGISDAQAKSQAMRNSIVKLADGLEPEKAARTALDDTYAALAALGAKEKGGAQNELKALQSVQILQAEKEAASGKIMREVFSFFDAIDAFVLSLPEPYVSFDDDTMAASTALMEAIGAPLVRMQKSVDKLAKTAEHQAVLQTVEDAPGNFERITRNYKTGQPPSVPLMDELKANLDEAKRAASALVRSLNADGEQVGVTEEAFKLLEEKADAATALLQAASSAHANIRVFESTSSDRAYEEAAKAFNVLKTMAQHAEKTGIAGANALAQQYEAQLTTLKTLIGSQDQTLREVVKNSASAGSLIEKVATSGAHEAVATTKQAFLAIATAMAVLILVAAGTIFIMERMISRPVRRMAQQMTKLADGDLSIMAHGSTRKNEIGMMEKAICVFHQNAKARVELEAQSESDRERDQVRQKTVDNLISEFRDDVKELMASFNAQAGQMVDTAQSLNAVASAADQKTGNATQSSQNSSANIQTVAAAAEELSISTEEINRQVETTSEVVENGARNARETSDRVSQLATSAQKIGDVVNLIQDIAEQTNLLALNATIEAARAGEMGKGFAIVAQEVKSLAAQTSNATSEIAGQIAGIQHASDDAVEAIMAINEIMANVQSHTRSIAASVVQQNEATREISLSAQKASEDADMTSTNMSGVSEAIKRTADSSGIILGTSNSLTEGAGNLSQRIDTFLKKVAAA